MWEEAGNQIVFCLEYDRSTESLERLAKKLDSYHDLQVATGLAYWICFCFGHPRREGRRSTSAGQCHRPSGHRGRGANTAAARSHLGAAR